MILPRKIIICGQTVSVGHKKDLRGDKEEELLGQCDYENNTIWLCKGMNKSKKLSVFIHEYWHYVYICYDLKWNEKLIIMHEVETLRLLRNLRLI